MRMCSYDLTIYKIFEKLNRIIFEIMWCSPALCLNNQLLCVHLQCPVSSSWRIFPEDRLFSEPYYLRSCKKPKLTCQDPFLILTFPSENPFGLGHADNTQIQVSEESLELASARWGLRMSPRAQMLALPAEAGGGHPWPSLWTLQVSEQPATSRCYQDWVLVKMLLTAEALPYLSQYLPLIRWFKKQGDT